ncbi:MAG: acyltransferase [Bacteroidia bacterium]|nr:acyltransferase [Bacteroidia bacterium]
MQAENKLALDLSQRNASVSFLRAIVAWAIFFFHYVERYPQHFPSVFSAWASDWFMLVNVFFVLSGFLLTLRYLPIAQTSANGWIKGFYMARIARILPLYFLALTLFFILQPNSDTKIYWLNFSLTKTYFSRYVFTGISQSWTLSIDGLFYLLFPVLLFLLRRSLWLLLGSSLLFYLFGLMLVWHLGFYMPWNFMPSVEYMLIYSLFGRIMEFLLGMVLASICISGNTFRYRVLHSASLVWAFSSGLVLLYLFHYYKFDFRWWGIYGSLGILIQNVLFPALVIVPVLWLLIQQVPGKLGSGLESMMVLLGSSSYAFYLFHVSPLADWILQLFHGQIWALFLAIQVLSILVFRYFEEPVRKWLMRQFGSGLSS